MHYELILLLAQHLLQQQNTDLLIFAGENNQNSLLTSSVHFLIKLD